MTRFIFAPPAPVIKQGSDPGVRPLTVISLLLAMLLVASPRAARPHYGGVLRIEMPSVIRALDPAIPATEAGERAARARVLPLVFETLVSVDDAGALRPALATSWVHDDRAVRWRFTLRPSVRLHDGSRLQAPQAASVLGAQEPAWRAGSSGDAVVIETDRPRPDLPWELAENRFAIVARTSAGGLLGTGPFRIDRVEPRGLALRAFEDHWAGRPFVDAVQIVEGRSYADLLSNVELGRADLVAVRPTDMRRLAQRGLRSAMSRPVDLFAMVFEPHRSGPLDEPVRTTIAASINRDALGTVVLQRQGEAAAALLPSWLSGYAPSFVLDSRAALSPAAVARLAPDRRTVILRVDASDSVAQEVAARVSVDAREAGITINVQVPAGLAPRPDARLVRVRLEATTPDRAFAAALTALGPRVAALPGGAPITAGAQLEAVLDAERSLLERAVFVPLVHVRDVYALGERVDSWDGSAVLGSGAWNLSNVWIRPDRVSSPW
jgi:ABC-type transport system substrate-binding protein